MTPSSPDEEERTAALALSLIAGVGPVRFRELLEAHGTARAALNGWRDARAAREAREEARSLIARADACGAGLLTATCATWPASLSELPQPPAVLWTRGDAALLDRRAVAIVGTRHPTPYGERTAHRLAGALAAAGAVVVSGLARGVDGAAHRGALEVGGSTIAVLGTGVDVAYPRSNAALHAEIAKRGLLLSEEPPGARPTPGSFPKRNRIIAALSVATIVVEADADSGALITAGHALELARSVAAVPGPIDSPRSRGANRLLRDGAIVIADIDDALALLGFSPAPRRVPPDLPPAARRLWDAAGASPGDVESLALACGLPVRECLEALTILEMAGAVECLATGEIRAV